MENIPLEDFLKLAYPKAGKRTIKKYLELIENHDIDALPRTPAMVRYDKVDLKLKELEAEKEKLRAEIIQQKERIGHQFKDMSVEEVTRKNFREDNFYKWVSSIVDPEILEEITVKTINHDLFKKLGAKGKIVYDDFPLDVYDESTSWRLACKRPRKKVSKECPELALTQNSSLSLKNSNEGTSTGG